MIIEKIIGKLSNYTHNKTIETVPFEWFEQNNKVLKKISSVGDEIKLKLSEPLFHDGILFEDEERIIVLFLLPCELIQIEISDIKEMGRACFELGNRHLPISFDEKRICVPYDNPTFEYIKKLGFQCKCITDKFIPEVFVRGHSHE